MKKIVFRIAAVVLALSVGAVSVFAMGQARNRNYADANMVGVCDNAGTGKNGGNGGRCRRRGM